MNNRNTFLLFTHPSSHPVYDEEIHQYTPADIREIFTPQESSELNLGRPVFKNGGIWINMVAAAREQAEMALEG